MKINAKITLLFNYRYEGNKENGLYLEVYDYDSHTDFLKIKLNKDQVVQALSRQGRTSCASAEVYNLDRVGKIAESMDFEIELPADYLYSSDPNREKVKQLVKQQCPEGWTPQLYFGSQSSFFEKDGKYFARTKITRWLDKEEVDDNRSKD